MAGRAVFGIYKTRDAAERAVSALKEAGFSSSDVAIILPESLGKASLTPEKATKAPEGAAAGGTSGLVLGGALGWLAGVGALAIPGLGPFIAAGPILGALAGAGLGSAVGGLTGALIGMGIPEIEAKIYEGRLAQGNILLSVHCDTPELADRAKQILETTHAEDISVTREEKVKQRAQSAKPTY
jgi:hypothetical protein